MGGQVERFLDTENAALVSMHYPEALRQIHFGTAPFNKGGAGEVDAEDYGVGGVSEESGKTERGAAATQRESGFAAAEGVAGETLVLTMAVF